MRAAGLVAANSPGPDTTRITAADHTAIEAEALGMELSRIPPEDCYAKRASMAKIERQLRKAYGDRIPGTVPRYISQRDEWDAIEQRQREQEARRQPGSTLVDLKSYGSGSEPDSDPEPSDCEGCGSEDAA